MAPEIAVVLCTLDRPDSLGDVLRDLRDQLPDSAEVVVVDQSGDAAAVPRLVAELADDRVRCVRQAPGLPEARNRGIAETTAPILLYLDDDVRLEPGCVAAHLRAFSDPTVGGVVGRIEERVVRPNAPGVVNRIGRGGRVRTRLDGRRATTVQTLKGCNMSFRRRALERAGGFDPAYGGTAFLEDADASTRVAADGWVLRFEPEAALIHLSAPTGGVRQADGLATEWWRFHNTARFMRTHRGMLAAPPLVFTFGAIACRRALEWRRPGALPRLLGALARGWTGADGTAKTA